MAHPREDSFHDNINRRATLCLKHRVTWLFPSNKQSIIAMHPLKGEAKASPRLNATNVYASTPCPLHGFDLGGRSPLPLAANVPIKPRATQCISLIIGDRRIRLNGKRVLAMSKSCSFVERCTVYTRRSRRRRSFVTTTLK